MYPLVGDDDNGGSDACVGAEDTWEISVHSAQFSCESKTAVKNKQKFL